MNSRFKKAALVSLLAGTVVTNSASADTLKLAFIDPLSGPFGVIGENFLKTFQVYIDAANKEGWAGDHYFEMKGFDNKAKVQDTLMQFRTMVDEGYRVIIQGNSSAAGLALTDAIEKHNRRNPNDPMVYINYSNGDPAMTNEKCSYWHFATSINLDMKLDAMTSMIAQDDSIKSVYLINQDYAMGHQVSRLIKEGLAKKNSRIEIVGDVLHPIGQVRDFAPYAANIKRAAPDVVVTGNWGNDFGLLARASKDAGVNAKFFGIYSAATGGPAAIREGWDGQVLTLTNWDPNSDDFIGEKYFKSVTDQFPSDELYYMQPDTYNAVKLLAEAVKEVDSIKLTEFVPAMPGLKFEGINGDELIMREDDHQLQSPLWSVVWKEVQGNNIEFEQDGTGHGWVTMAKMSISDTTTPTSCKMTRP